MIYHDLPIKDITFQSYVEPPQGKHGGLNQH